MSEPKIVSLIAYKAQKKLPRYTPELFAYFDSLSEDDAQRAFAHVAEQMDLDDHRSNQEYLKNLPGYDH